MVVYMFQCYSLKSSHPFLPPLCPKICSLCLSTRSQTSFSQVQRVESKLEANKSSLGKFKKIEIIPVIFSDHSKVRLDLNYRKKIIKNSNIWRLNNTLLNNQQIIEEIKKEIKNMHKNE